MKLVLGVLDQPGRFQSRYRAEKLRAKAKAGAGVL